MWFDLRACFRVKEGLIFIKKKCWFGKGIGWCLGEGIVFV